MKIRLAEIKHGWDVQAMSNYNSKETNIINSICIWVSQKGGAQHGALIKVSKIRGHFAQSDADRFSVTVGPKPEVVDGKPDGFTSKELQSIYDWVLLNQ